MRVNLHVDDFDGSHSGINDGFKATLKRDLFVQGLLRRWQEKVLEADARGSSWP